MHIWNVFSRKKQQTLNLLEALGSTYFIYVVPVQNFKEVIRYYSQS